MKRWFEAQTMEECPCNGSNVKRMDGRIANEEEAEEWGQNELEATLIGARKASKKKANADARPPVVPLVLSHSSSHPSPSNRDISAPFDHRLTPFFFRYSCSLPGAIAISSCPVSRVLLRGCIHLAVVACTIPSLASCQKKLVVDIRHITSFGPDIPGLQGTLHGPEDPSSAQRETGFQRVTKAAIRSKMYIREPGQDQGFRGH